MSTFVFPISDFNNLMSQYALAAADYAKYSARGLNSKNDICSLRCARQIILALYNNIPASLQSQIEYQIYSVPFNGKLPVKQIQCLFAKLKEILKNSPSIPPVFPPNTRMWFSTTTDIRVDGNGNTRVWR